MCSATPKWLAQTDGGAELIRDERRKKDGGEFLEKTKKLKTNSVHRTYFPRLIHMNFGVLAKTVNSKALMYEF